MIASMLTTVSSFPPSIHNMSRPLYVKASIHLPPLYSNKRSLFLNSWIWAGPISVLTKRMQRNWMKKNLKDTKRNNTLEVIKTDYKISNYNSVGLTNKCTNSPKQYCIESRNTENTKGTLAEEKQVIQQILWDCWIWQWFSLNNTLDWQRYRKINTKDGFTWS